MSQAKSLTDSELKRLLTVVSSLRQGARNRLIVMFSHWSGMRVGEIASLKISNVVNEDLSIKDSAKLDPDQTKGSHYRTVHLPKKLQDEISVFVKSIRITSVQQPLFSTQKKKSGFSANSLCSTMKTWYVLAGIDDGSSHSGRRTFLTRLSIKGVSARVLQELAGHRNLATTQRYIDVNDEMKRNAIELIV